MLQFLHSSHKSASHREAGCDSVVCVTACLASAGRAAGGRGTACGYWAASRAPSLQNILSNLDQQETEDLASPPCCRPPTAVSCCAVWPRAGATPPAPPPRPGPGRTPVPPPRGSGGRQQSRPRTRPQSGPRPSSWSCSSSSLPGTLQQLPAQYSAREEDPACLFSLVGLAGCEHQAHCYS